MDHGIPIRTESQTGVWNLDAALIIDLEGRVTLLEKMEDHF